MSAQAGNPAWARDESDHLLEVLCQTFEMESPLLEPYRALQTSIDRSNLFGDVRSNQLGFVN